MTSALDSHEAALADDRGAPRALGQILAHLGTTFVQLVTDDIDLGVRVSGLRVYGRAAAEPVPRASVVLGIGVDGGAELDRLIDSAGAAGAAAVVVRSGSLGDDSIARARAHGLAVVCLSPGASWMQLVALLDPQRSTADPVVERPAALTGELFDMANVICTLIDAPVTIEDRHGNLLAFSDRQEEADFVSRECILGRSSPTARLRGSAENDALEALRRSGRPVHVGAVHLPDGREIMPRTAAPIRIGEEHLGIIWAAVRAPLSSDQERYLQDGARMIALHMVGLRSRLDTRNRLLSDQVAMALGGGDQAATAMDELGLADGPSAVVTLAFGDARSTSDRDRTDVFARRFADLQRVATALTLHLDGGFAGSVAAAVDGQVYALVPTGRRPEAERALEQSLRQFLTRAFWLREPVFAAIGRTVEPHEDLSPSRRDADRAVRVLRETGRDRVIAQWSACELEALLLEAREILSLRGWGPTEAFGRLLEYDVAHRAPMCATLRAWLDAEGDIVAAATATHVHQNTLRYRLKRISEIGPFDLDDPRTRFELALQLRLFAVADEPEARR